MCCWCSSRRATSPRTGAAGDASILPATGNLGRQQDGSGKEDALLPLIDAARTIFPCRAFILCARTGDGVSLPGNPVAPPASPPIFRDMLTDRPEDLSPPKSGKIISIPTKRSLTPPSSWMPSRKRREGTDPHRGDHKCGARLLKKIIMAAGAHVEKDRHRRPARNGEVLCRGYF